MADLIEIRRVTIIAETAIENTLVQEILRLGAKGYTSFYCFGKGRHEVMEDPYTGRSLVQIEVLARPEVAETILAYTHGAGFKNYPTISYLDPVLVYRDDTFF